MPLESINFDLNLFNRGYKYIAGVDEAGRGPLAGPIVFSAVILDLEKIKARYNDIVSGNFCREYLKIDDSKKISSKKRLVLNDFLVSDVLDYSIVEISHALIDKNGISWSTQEGFFNCISKLKIKPDFIVTDHFEIKKISKQHQQNLPKGDSISISIASASILAKVFRDRLMVNEHNNYPEYGFDLHKGYGTKKHIDNIKKFGICLIHRKSFEPIKSYFGAGFGTDSTC